MGTEIFDYDNDGNMDLMVADDFRTISSKSCSHQVTYKEPLLCFETKANL